MKLIELDHRQRHEFLALFSQKKRLGHIRLQKLETWILPQVSTTMASGSTLAASRSRSVRSALRKFVKVWVQVHTHLKRLIL